MIRPRGEDGNIAVELSIVLPVLLLFFLLAVGWGRIGHAREEVQVAAAQAARAASLDRDPATVQASAHDAAEASLTGDNLSCAQLQVVTDASDDVPGGLVKVSVTCTVELSDVMLVGFPGHFAATATSTSPVDLYLQAG